MLQDVTVALEFQYDKARQLVTGHEPALGDDEEGGSHVAVFGSDHLFHIQSLCAQISREYLRKKSLLDPFLSSLSGRAATDVDAATAKAIAKAKAKTKDDDRDGGSLAASSLSDFSPDSYVSGDVVDSFIQTNNLSDGASS